jgi:hypothetical protein
VPLAAGVLSVCSLSSPFISLCDVPPSRIPEALFLLFSSLEARSPADWFTAELIDAS